MCESACESISSLSSLLFPFHRHRCCLISPSHLSRQPRTSKWQRRGETTTTTHKTAQKNAQFIFPKKKEFRNVLFFSFLPIRKKELFCVMSQLSPSILWEEERGGTHAKDVPFEIQWRRPSCLIRWHPFWWHRQTDRRGWIYGRRRGHKGWGQIPRFLSQHIMFFFR